MTYETISLPSRKINLQIEFENYRDLINSLKEYGEYLMREHNTEEIPQPAPAKKEKKADDKRGVHIRAVHAAARELRKTQPELKYKDAFKIASSKKE